MLPPTVAVFHLTMEFYKYVHIIRVVRIFVQAIIPPLVFSLRREYIPTPPCQGQIAPFALQEIIVLGEA